MRLKKYLDAKKMSIQAFADAIDTSHESVRRYVHGTRYPRPATAQRIVSFTKGSVTLADIYGGRS